MDTAEKVDWAALNAHAAGRPARRLVSKAITAAGGDRPGGIVLDLGAGAGADSLQFARRGWTVHAYDADDTLAARLVENERMSGSVEFHHTDLTEVERTCARSPPAGRRGCRRRRRHVRLRRVPPYRPHRGGAVPGRPDRLFDVHPGTAGRSEEHTSELQSRGHLVCRLLLEKKKKNRQHPTHALRVYRVFIRHAQKLHS